jgi:hypothetical protein
MLKLYYTTTKGEDELQPKFFKSLGGYKSSSLVKNDQFDNFFSEISNYSIAENNGDEYIGLMLVNEGTDKTNINFYFDYPTNCYSKLYVAAVDTTTDADGNEYIENVPTIHSSPVYADFNEADGEVNKVSLGNLLANEQLGLWIKRELLMSVIEADKGTLVQDDPDPDASETRVVAVEKDKVDSIGLVFSYD